MPDRLEIIALLIAVLVGVAATLLLSALGSVSGETARDIGILLFVLFGLIGLMVTGASKRLDRAQELRRLDREIDEIALALDELTAKVDELGSGGAGDHDRNRELVSEMKVLQTLLTQIAGGRVQQATGPLAKGEAGPRELPKSESPKKADGDELLTIIRNALQENRVDLYLQPIVRLPSRRPAHYECYSRVRDENGTIIFPRDYLPVAEESGLAGTLDNLLTFRCIQVIRRLGTRRPRVRFFCNMSHASVNDPEFFPQFVDFMTNHQHLSRRLVFELAQKDFDGLTAAVEQKLLDLGSAGYRFSIDHVEDLGFDISGLAQRFIRFVKVDADKLLSADQGDFHISDLNEACRRHDIRLIAAMIEKERSVVELLEHNIGYGQGYLFGEPKPSRTPRYPNQSGSIVEGQA